MARNPGRAYVFVRWTGSQSGPTRLGEVGWAFEYNDRLGRFFCFYCGAAERNASSAGLSARFWHEKCLTLPELVKAMSSKGAERSGYDEAKVFEVDHAEPELALQMVALRSTLPDDLAVRRDPLEDTREILIRYGVRGVADSKGFSAPFLWYNMLPGRSVPVRKLAVHLFQLRASAQARVVSSAAEIEDYAREIVGRAAEVLSIGECLVCRTGSAYVVGLNVAVDPRLSIRSGRAIAERLEHTIRYDNPQIRHVFVRIDADDAGE